MAHKNSMNLDAVDVLPEQAVEIARLWVTHQGPSTVFINAHTLADPAMFGMLLSDTAMHGAKAYAQALGISETQAMERIWEGLDAERDNPSSDLTLDDKPARKN